MDDPLSLCRARSEEEDQRLQGCQEKGQGEKGGRAQVPLWRDQQQEEERLLGECVCEKGTGTCVSVNGNVGL